MANDLTVKATTSISERFAKSVIEELETSFADGIKVTPKERQLIRGYFVAVDRMLKVSEEQRLNKNKKNKDHSFDNDLPYIWQNVNMTALAEDLAALARIGLDATFPNMVSFAAFKNTKTNKYDILAQKGYAGLAFVAMKYSLHGLKQLRPELVYSTDTFKILKANAHRDVETYEFEINNPFDRGEFKGGFVYLAYENATLNRVVYLSKKEIDKRKPSRASAEFWGGIKTEWKDGKEIKTEVEGWYDEMARKTIIKHAAKQVEADPTKIDDAYRYAERREVEYAEAEAREAIADNANTVLISADGEVQELESPKAETPAAPAVETETEKPQF